MHVGNHKIVHPANYNCPDQIINIDDGGRAM